ncbi:MAG: PorT family protein [Candidatus Symbiothrix sp.]|jgi:hypothetical protein|nr:PorT family protein [Candidatus Symbiothrix sp.]
MKKRIGGFIFLFFTLVSYSQAQEFQREWAFGANAGATLSKISFNPGVPQDFLIQQEGGLTLRYISEKNFGIQLELNYSLRGWKEQVDTVVHPNQYSRSLAYLELPLMTHIYFDMGKRARMVFNLGPQIGYNLSEKVLQRIIVSPPGEVPGYYGKTAEQESGYKVQNKFDYGLAGGMGIEVRTGIGSFILEGRYYFGLSDVFNNEKKDYFQASSNQVIGIKLSYLFQIKN